MKNTLIKVLLLLGYCIPFVFLAMYEDVTSGTLWFFLIMLVGFTVLCSASIKSKNSWIVPLGNLLSFASSCIFAWNFQTEKWGWYFKPFTPYQTIIFETIFAFAVQLIFVLCSMRKHKRNENIKK